MESKVILSANVSHYIYAAKAIYQAGMLRRYICAVSINKRSKVIRLLPQYWRKKILSRDISEIDKRLVHSLWLPELAQRGLPALGLISKERGNRINNSLYDIMARQWITPCTIFHSLPNIGLYSSRKARKLGAVVICDAREEYPDFQEEIVQEEYLRLGLVPPSKSPISLRMEKDSYTESDYIILPSSYAKDTFVNAGYSAQKIFVLPYGVDLAWFPRFYKTTSQQEKTIPPKFSVIYAGSITPRKGVHYLLKAFLELDIPNSELLIVGGIDPAMFSTIHPVSKTRSKVRFLGHIPKNELYKHYNEASVFVLPSLADSFGLVCLEAMACALPVIVTQNTGSKEAVCDGENGFVVPIRDIDAIKEKLYFLYENPERRLDMGRKAFDVARTFTWKIYGNRLINIYSMILNK